MGQCCSSKRYTSEQGFYDYDLIVIGGGSGGIAAAKEAAKYSRRVLVCDFVTPSPINTTWGLGGTCVNVGCIPKILMHQASIASDKINDSASYGWKNITSDKKIMDWNFLVEKVQSYIRTLNWDYELSLGLKNVAYLNEFATLQDEHTVHTTAADGSEQSFTGKHILLAIGGRPKYPSIPGAKEFGITSDDLFSLPYNPGKTLCVGASYVAVECAGFLASFGCSVTVLARSVMLRGFDQQMATLIEKTLITKGVEVIKGMVPIKIEKVADGTPPILKVTIQGSDGGITHDMEVNTVLFAIGRDPCTKALNLDKVGVHVSENGRILVDEADRTTVKNIFAIGDAADGRPELTPVAISAGINLSRRLYNRSHVLTDYVNIPTTIYSCIEYGCIGLSEESAEEKYGKNNIEVYHSNFIPIDCIIPKKGALGGYAKVICLKSQNEKLVGLHYMGPNAGDVTQGFTLAFIKGCTKADLDSITAIHPTNAEILTQLNITKSSGKSPAKEDC